MKSHHGRPLSAGCGINNSTHLRVTILLTVGQNSQRPRRPRYSVRDASSDPGPYTIEQYCDECDAGNERVRKVRADFF